MGNANALVKYDSLECYDWEHEDRLIVISKITNLAEDVDLYYVYNIDKNEYGDVTTDQMIPIDADYLNMEYTDLGSNGIMVDGPNITIVHKPPNFGSD